MQAGDHIFVQRNLIKNTLGYTHHGIYVGHGQVIHYAGYAQGFSRGNDNQKVSLTTLADFCAGQQASIKTHQSHYSRSEVIDRARSRLNEDKYSLLISNCEHFANWCWTNKATSRQVWQVGAGSCAVALLAGMLFLTPKLIRDKS